MLLFRISEFYKLSTLSAAEVQSKYYRFRSFKGDQATIFVPLRQPALTQGRDLSRQDQNILPPLIKLDEVKSHHHAALLAFFKMYWPH